MDRQIYQIYEDFEIDPLFEEEVDFSALNTNHSIKSEEDPLALDTELKEVKEEIEVVSDDEVRVFKIEPSDEKSERITTIPLTSEIYEYKGENVWIKKDTTLEEEFNESNDIDNVGNTSQSDLSFQLKEEKCDSFIETSSYSDLVTMKEIETNFHSSSSSSEVSEENEKLICQFCGSTFKTSFDLCKHECLFKVNKPMLLFCDSCKMTFNKVSDLDKHILTNGSEAPLICDFCKKRFFTSCKYNIHLQNHTNEIERYSCDVCKESFLTSKFLTKHMKAIHRSKKRYTCRICKTGFLKYTDLKYHTCTSGTVGATYVCQRCKKSFKSFWKLKLHGMCCQNDLCDCDPCKKLRSTCKKKIEKSKMIEVDLDVKQVTCDRCKVSFLCDDNLRYKIHFRSRLAPYFCRRCNNKSFSDFNY